MAFAMPFFFWEVLDGRPRASLALSVRQNYATCCRQAARRLLPEEARKAAISFGGARANAAGDQGASVTPTSIGIVAVGRHGTRMISLRHRSLCNFPLRGSVEIPVGQTSSMRPGSEQGGIHAGCERMSSSRRRRTRWRRQRDSNQPRDGCRRLLRSR
jgi:hypothetical protein